MNKASFKRIVRNPLDLTDDDQRLLEELTASFPFCQVGHILAAKSFADNSNMLADKKMRTAAAYSADRKVLKRLIRGTAKAVQKPIPGDPPVPVEHPPKKEEVKTVEPIDAIETTQENLQVSNLDPPQKKTIAEELAETLQKLKDSREEAEPLELEANETSTLKKVELTEDTTEPIQPPAEKEAQEVIELSTDEVVEPTDENTVDVVELQEEEEIAPPAETEIETVSIEPKAKTPKHALEIPEPKKKTPEEPAAEEPQIPKKPKAKKKAPPKKQYPSVPKPEVPMSDSRLGSELDGDVHTNTIEYADFLLSYLQRSPVKKEPSSKKVEKPSQKAPSKKKAPDQDAILNEFITKEPSISRKKPNEIETTSQGDLSKDSGEENPRLITENLARINAKQGNLGKAISIYEQLILKFPEKRTYFAGQIAKLSK